MRPWEARPRVGARFWYRQDGAGVEQGQTGQGQNKTSQGKELHARASTHRAGKSGKMVNA